MKNLIMSENISQPKLLDVGCGRPCPSMKDGAFLEYMGFGTGIDIELKNISFPFNSGDIKNIPYPKNSFDIVVAAEVLEHVTEPEKSLKDIKRVLKPKGIFIFTTPNNTPLWNMFWFFWEKTFGKMWKNLHTINYTQKQWLELLKKYFNIEKKVIYRGVVLIIKLRNNK